MTVLDTFYILFKNNAPQAKKDAEALDAQLNKVNKTVADLAAKGTARTKVEENNIKVLRDRQRSLVRDIKDLRAGTEGAGDSFTEMAKNALVAFGAYKAVATVTNSVFEQATFNRNLGIQARVWGQNSQQVLAYGAAAKAAGADMSAFMGAVQGAVGAASQAGLQLDVPAYFTRVNRQLQGFSKSEQARQLGLLGITDPALMDFLEQAPEKFDAAIAGASKLARVNEQSTQVAEEFGKTWDNVGTAFASVATAIGTEILPGLKALAEIIVPLLGAITDKIPTIFGFLKDSGVAVGGGLSYLLYGDGSSTKPSAGLLNPGAANIQRAKPITLDASNKNLQESMRFWMANGYTASQAAGLAAREQLESNGNPNAAGDNGAAFGIFQWHADRRRAIKAGTGIDVLNSSHQDQLRAALWELQNTESRANSAIRSAQTADEAGRAVSLRFIRPGVTDEAKAREADRTAQLATSYHQRQVTSSVEAGQAALQDQNSGRYSYVLDNSGRMIDPATGKSTSVTIGQLHVNTQATDAEGMAKGASEALQKHISGAAANFDDGVKM